MSDLFQLTQAERERNIITGHLERELMHARFLLQEQRYEEAAEAFEQVARRCRSLVEEEE